MRSLVITVLAVSFVLLPLGAQAQVAPPIDSAPPFAKARRLSDSDLAKKREGAFFIEIPDISSDPVAGQGFGVRGAIFFNGQRSDPLFAYTPYRAKLKIGAFAATSAARELAVQIDVPYVFRTRWRVKLDVKVADNPANLYFGLRESTLEPLTLPSGAATYATYRAFDAARKTLRPGDTGEAALLTDALSNRFGEQELMLNLKSDYALGSVGRWRVLLG